MASAPNVSLACTPLVRRCVMFVLRWRASVSYGTCLERRVADPSGHAVFGSFLQAHWLSLSLVKMKIVKVCTNDARP